ncbi:MAG: MotA/TolQ/ExbB proton channel family protein [Phycisphaerae bacterium]|nr:MotA/TolQ/ExbB proton channel family protein [Phycisphaerae bacterium]
MKKFSFIVLLMLMVDSAFGADAGGSNFDKFFMAGGPLVWVVLLPLSLVTVSIIVQMFISITRSKLIPSKTVAGIRDMLANNQLGTAANAMDNDNSMLARVLKTGIDESCNGRAAMDTAMIEMLEQDSTSLMRKIEWLNMIGNVAPMVGLFGTVWGMIDAFNGIVQAGGQPDVPDLAKGISTALVTTWWGMAVAIPALASYGILRNKIDNLAAETAVTAEQLLHKVK